ncbi:MAG TPA: twin-arginine translocation pathway signal protein, partial [Desulfobacterales bacterium]|nr:twin-arginine translocation pathway signal protein [Desulfobacterales bacterium]
MKSLRIFLVWGVTALLVILMAGQSVAKETIKLGEINTYSKLTSFTFPYRNGWKLAL